MQVLEKSGDVDTQLYQMEWYELLEINGPWWDMVGKKEESWINNKIVILSKDSSESLLTFFNKDMEIE